MPQALQWMRTIGWLVHKDLQREFRARQALPATLLLGALLVLMLAMQLDLPEASRIRVGGGLFWVVTLFANAFFVEKSYAAERDSGCWQALSLYPIAPSALFLSKWLLILLAMCCFECLLLPVFSVLAGLPLPSPLSAMALVALLANAGFAAIGAFLGAVTSSLQERGFLLVLLQLPLVIPVALGASEATRLLMMEQTGAEWWRWIQLLTVFAVIYLAAGMLLFEFVTEE